MTSRWLKKTQFAAVIYNILALRKVYKMSLEIRRNKCYLFSISPDVHPRNGIYQHQHSDQGPVIHCFNSLIVYSVFKANLRPC